MLRCLYLHSFSVCYIFYLIIPRIFPQSYKLSLTLSSTKGQDDDPNQKNKFFLTKEDVKDSRGRYTRKPRKPSRSKSDENEEVIVVDTPSHLPKEETPIEMPESVGILSNDKKSITSVYPQDQTVEEEVLSVSQPQDVEDRQAHLAQGRRLESDALQVFQARCDASTPAGVSGIDAYVDCDGGYAVIGGSTDFFTSCADACGGGGLCCTGIGACDGFTGKGEQISITIASICVSIILQVTYTNALLLLFSSLSL